MILACLKILLSRLYPVIEGGAHNHQVAGLTLDLASDRKCKWLANRTRVKCRESTAELLLRRLDILINRAACLDVAQHGCTRVCQVRKLPAELKRCLRRRRPVCSDHEPEAGMGKGMHALYADEGGVPHAQWKGPRLVLRTGGLDQDTVAPEGHWGRDRPH